MKFDAWWDFQSPQFKASVGSIENVRDGFAAGYHYGQSNNGERIEQVERENKELRAEHARSVEHAEWAGSVIIRNNADIVTLTAEIEKLRAKVAEQENTIATYRRIAVSALCGVAQQKEGE